MYRPLLLAAWYSSAGMVRNLSVFMGVSFWFSRRPPLVGVYPVHSGFFSKRQDDSAKILEFRAKKRQDGKKAVWREKQEGAVEWNLCSNYIMYIRGSTLVGIVMPIVIIAILGIALVLYARKRNSDEIRRIHEKAERDATLA